jgi:hypothetical protein
VASGRRTAGRATSSTSAIAAAASGIPVALAPADRITGSHLVPATRCSSAAAVPGGCGSSEVTSEYRNAGTRSSIHNATCDLDNARLPRQAIAAPVVMAAAVAIPSASAKPIHRPPSSAAPTTDA